MASSKSKMNAQDCKCGTDTYQHLLEPKFAKIKKTKQEKRGSVLDKSPKDIIVIAIYS